MATLITGVYGMNFRTMPELRWELGYPFAIACCAVGPSSLRPGPVVGRANLTKASPWGDDRIRRGCGGGAGGDCMGLVTGTRAPRTSPGVARARTLADTFTELEFSGLPEPVGRYFAAAIAPGVALDRSVLVDVRGRVRHRRWVPFRARYQLTRTFDFIGVGHAGELGVGVERYVGGAAMQHVRLAGLVPLRTASGIQLSRSAAGRAALSALVLPTALLPRFGVHWAADDDGLIRGTMRVHGQPIVLRLRIDEGGHPLAAVVDRWGDPLGSGWCAMHAFGAVFTEQATFSGLTVPSAGRAGWFIDTGRWPDGENVRFRVTASSPGAFGLNGR